MGEGGAGRTHRRYLRHAAEQQQWRANRICDGVAVVDAMEEEACKRCRRYFFIGRL
jgi:molybdenum cofactor biosynthesis enzyme MoaA